MAAELTVRADGFTEMAFVGETPWHGSGQKLEEGATIEQWQVAAGMDWEIKTTPVQYMADAGGFSVERIIDDRKVLYRSDNQEALSVVSNGYHEVQPKEVLEFFRDLVAENGFKIHTAGTLRGGRRMWALAETGKFGEVSKDDGIGGFLLLSTSADRTLATTARFTTVRVVCSNTLSMAHGNNANTVSFNHMTRFDHGRVKQQLGNAVESFGSFMQMARYLRERQMTSTKADVFLTKLLKPVHVDEFDVTKNRAYQAIGRLYAGDAKGADMAGHTAWGMLNAVTEYVDHVMPSQSQAARLDKSWFGIGERMKNRAVELLLA